MAFFDHIGGDPGPQSQAPEETIADGGDFVDETIQASQETPIGQEPTIEPTQETETLHYDSKTGILTDTDGNKWSTVGGIKKLSDFSRYKIEQIIEREKLNVRSEELSPGKNVQLYPVETIMDLLSREDAIPKADEKTGTLIDEGVEWAPAQLIADQHLNGRSIAPGRLKGIQTKRVVARNGQTRNFYPVVEVLKNITDYQELPKAEEDGIYRDPETQTEWAPIRVLADILNLDPITVGRSIGPEISTKECRTRSGAARPFYPVNTVRELCDRYVSLPVVGPDGICIYSGQKWVAINTAAKLFGDLKLRNLFRAAIKQGEVTHIKGKFENGGVFELYNLDMLTTIRDNLLSIPEISADGTLPGYGDRRFMTINGMVRKLDITWDMANKFLAGGQEPVIGREGNSVNEYYDTSGIEDKIADHLQTPQADEDGVFKDENNVLWATVTKTEKEAGVAAVTIENKGNEIGTKQGRNFKGAKATLYNLARAKEIFADFNARRGERKLENELLDDSNPVFQQIRDVVDIVGLAAGMDILYAQRPEYRKIAPDKVRGVIAEYLGDFLVQKRPFDLDNLDKLREYPELLANENLYQGLISVLKGATLAKIRGVSNHDLEATLDVTSEFLHQIRQKGEELGNDQLVQAATEVETYWVEVLTMGRPNSMIDQLQEDRLFPDVNQRINIKEILSQQSMLIADEMGLGKSASAIMTCETVRQRVASAELAEGEEPRVARTLIIAPSNTIAIWRRFLSSEVGESGEQVGYFQPGQEPVVVEVGGQLDLLSEEAKSADYLLISQERMTDEYAKLLEPMEFDVVVADEVHKLKNVREGVRSNNFLDIATRQSGEGKYLVMLSGTPIPNKVEDIALYLKALYPERFTETDVATLTHQVIHGDIVGLRSLLVPKMQRKELAESIEMPGLSQETVEIELSDQEREIYEALLDDDETEASTKIMVLRQFLLNPEILGVVASDGSENWSKKQRLWQEISEGLESDDRIVVFVNGYVEGVLRGEETILDGAQLPEGVELSVIDGQTPASERGEIQLRLNSRSSKMVVFVSGQTADVGVDYSGASRVIEYNEPWSQYDRRQQVGRVWRYGQTEAVSSKSMVVKGTIEEGIHYYIAAKEKAIEKLLKGVPITELEQQLLEEDEKDMGENLEVNPELAEYYISAWNRMLKIYSQVKEMGQEDFTQFLSRYGKEYADCYCELGPRSYQANANRIDATIISNLVAESGQNPQELHILDLASGPEMLRQHAPAQIAGRIASLDLNPEHFGSSESGMAAVAAMQELPVQDKSVDYVNLAMALHYTKFVPSRGHFERLNTLIEINRVLKAGGVAVINNIYSVDFKKPEQTVELLKALGFEIVGGYSGEVESGQDYKSGVYTIRKVADAETDLEKYSDSWDGIKFGKSKRRVGNTRAVVESFTSGNQEHQINLNSSDQEILRETREIEGQAEELIDQYETIDNIPREILVENSFGRYFNGKRYALFKKSELASGFVIIKQPT